MGYAPIDIISVVFRIVKNFEMPEFLKLEYIKVRTRQNITTVQKLNTTVVLESS